MPIPPMSGGKMWLALIGPGVVLAGTSIGTGEWLFGPAVSAQYGATLLWMALTSIILQVFCNLMAMRYAIYCGEPMIVGALRTRPGPKFWIMVIIVLDFGAIWPYNASNAAVPLAAAFLGRLPQQGPDDFLVKSLGFAIFLLAFVPLVFGGTVYRMLEKIMTAKLVVVLGFLSFVAVFFVSPGVMWDVAKGFVGFGTVPLRPDVLIVGRHFNIKFQTDGQNYRLAGTWEPDGTATGDLYVPPGYEKANYDLRKRSEWPSALVGIPDAELARTKSFAKSQRYFLQTTDQGNTWTMEGEVIDHHRWTAQRIEIREGDETASYSALEQVPEPHRGK
ncbi:MAG TPA: Nramp family divalent metal transporter, partial [Pirellulaceae bacterium]|nr:Nramp family divalent metal transporter [Pirellulaceae bacterium]